MRSDGSGTTTAATPPAAPRRVEPIEIVEAGGIVLGSDGKRHPLEEIEQGVLHIGGRTLYALLEEQNILLRQIVLGLSILTCSDLTEGETQ